MSNADDRCDKRCREPRYMHDRPYDCGHPFVEPAPQPAPMRLSTPVPLPWDMPTLSREDARIARERINPAPRWPSQPEPDKVIASCEAGIDECSFECQQYGQRHTPENAGTAWCPTCLKSGIYTASCEHMKPAPQPSPSGDEAKVLENARAEAESIAMRWVPAHMTARQGMVDDITASLVRYRALGADAGKADGAREAWKIADDLSVLFDERGDSVGCNAACQIRDAIARRGSEGK